MPCISLSLLVQFLQILSLENEQFPRINSSVHIDGPITPRDEMVGNSKARSRIVTKAAVARLRGMSQGKRPFLDQFGKDDGYVANVIKGEPQVFSTIPVMYAFDIIGEHLGNLMFSNNTPVGIE